MPEVKTKVSRKADHAIIPCKRKKFKSKESCTKASFAYSLISAQILYVPKYCRRCRAWHFNFTKPEKKDARHKADQRGVLEDQ